MRAVTLHQPWASLIAHGYKTTETRGWPAPQALVGSRVAIHAAKRRPRRTEWNRQVAEIAGRMEMPLGAVVATARVDGYVRVLSVKYWRAPTARPGSDTRIAVGAVDTGISPMATDSEGQVWENPKAYYRAERKLRRWQRTQSRRRPGSAGAGGKPSGAWTGSRDASRDSGGTPSAR